MKYAPQSGFVFDRQRSLSFEGETGGIVNTPMQEQPAY